MSRYSAGLAATRFYTYCRDSQGVGFRLFHIQTHTESVTHTHVIFALNFFWKQIFLRIILNNDCVAMY